MRKILAVILFLIPIGCFAQQSLKEIRKKSWQTFVYQITALDAIQYERWDSIPVNKFFDLPALKVSPANSYFEENLPIGHYVFISVIYNKITAELYNRSNLLVLPINNKQQLQLDIRTREGKYLSEAKVFVNDKATVFNTLSQTYWVKNKSFEEAKVLVYAAGDTLITYISALDDLRIPVHEQKKNNYRRSKMYKVLNWVPQKIQGLFKEKRKPNNIGASGFIIFNQPKYKPLDTVKFKGYVVDKKWKQYSKKINVFLEYYANGKSYSQKITTLSPISAGAFVYAFVIADSVPTDISCNLSFKSLSGKEIIREKFKIEDYVLDEIGTQQFRSEKETYFRNDSLRFFAGAKDANGLYVMDATAKLVLTTSKIEHFYQDTLFVADTLYNNEVKLKTDAETKFVIDASGFPKADLLLQAKLIFKNANNELQEKVETISYLYESKTIFVKQLGDSIKAVYIENGKEKIASGEMEMNDEDAVNIKYPFAIKIDPIAEDYSFYFEDATDTLKANFEIKNNNDVDFTRISLGDTLGFILDNPYKVPVYFTVFNGRQIIATGKQSEERITWKKIVTDRRRVYKVRWQYYWAGEEKQKEENIALLYKLLNIKIKADDNVFPGQEDSIIISVTDYKDHPAANVNLTAVSYNNQFKKDINVKDPPYLVRYKSKKYIERDGFETDSPDESILTKKYLFGNYAGWINRFGLDTMEYYKLLFPPQKYYDAVTSLSNIIPQVSVHVVDKGVPQEIYLLYINRQLVYYNGVTDRMKYAYEVFPENVQLGIRLKNKYIQIDSLYVQPYYKHDLSFDLNDLPTASSVRIKDTFWSNAEMEQIERSIWLMQNSYTNNNAFLWQDKSLVHLSGDRDHIAGPFRENEWMNFFSPNYFDISFKFEPGYQYSLSKQILRLEKKAIFPRKDLKNALMPKETSFILGDTLSAPPLIFYPVTKRQPFLILAKDEYRYYYGNNINGMGKIHFTSQKDSSIKYIVLRKSDPGSKPLVLAGNNKTIINLEPGNYSLLLVSNSFAVAAFENISVTANGTECIKMEKTAYQFGHPVIYQLLDEATGDIKKIPENPIVVKEPVKIYLTPDSIIYTKTGGAFINGTISDKKGKKPISFCSIVIKGSKVAVQANLNGEYSFSNLRPGKYTLIFSQVGYERKEVEIEVVNGSYNVMNAILEMSNLSLSEVVVTSAYSVKRTLRSTSANIQTVSSEELSIVRNSNVSNALAGRVAGVQVRSQSDGMPGSGTIITLRGENSVLAGSGPIYVVDGIVYANPQNIDPNLILDITVLKDAEAVGLFGAQGSNGAIIITTKTKTERKDFRDYAFWVPNFFTNKNGVATVKVAYPDNVTAWKTYVVGMDKNRRMGKASVLTQAFKPMLAQLNLPLFLIEGDSSYFVTKSINYTADIYKVKTEFSLNGSLLSSKEKELLPNDASVEEQLVANTQVDTVTASFAIKSTTGFKDMEQRKIPVFKKGTEEATGNFWVLQKDTTVLFNAKQGISSINIYAQNNTLDLMLEELEQLRRYPYYCMEQICSKITGLVLEKKIKDQLKQPFKNQKELDGLLKKIQKTQQFDGGWAWWENGKSNFYISNYVADALLVHRENPLVEVNIRNAFLYLNNKLPYLSKDELLEALTTLSNGKHEMNYAAWINKIDFDSINQHQQWQWVKIKQQQNLEYKAELDTLVKNKIATMLGGVHWGTENYRWYSNEVATTILAFDVLKNENRYKNLLPAIIQYFLGKRQNGYWRNTVETAGILNTILPNLLSANENFSSPAKLSVSGDTSFTIQKFPYQLKTNNPTFKALNINKQGGGMVYFTAYQTYFNTDPHPVEDNFILSTTFKKNDETVAIIKSGERIKMLIKVEVLKDAEFVMLTIPIPAGCIFSNKTNNDWRVFKEYRKDRFLLFAETLKKGIHQYEVELEPRYNGSYQLNPAKATLMYYPTFYGRNATRKIEIVK